MDLSLPLEQKNDNFPLVTPTKAVSLTNQPSTRCWEELFRSGEAGIDTVKVTVPIWTSSIKPESNLWNPRKINYYQFGQLKGLVGHLRNGYGGVRVTVNAAISKMYVEFDAPKLVSRDPLSLFNPPDLPWLLNDVLLEMRDAISPRFNLLEAPRRQEDGEPPWVGDIELLRIDLARGFLIDDQAPVRRALIVTEPDYWKTHCNYWGPKGSWTFEHRTARVGRDRFYDKKAQLVSKKAAGAEECPEGAYRFEAQLEGNRLDTFGRSLKHLTVERCARVLEERWKALHWGVTIGEPNTLEKSLGDLSWKQQDEVIGYLRRAVNGTTSVYNDRKRSALRKQALEHGLNPGLPLDEQGPPTRRLDLKQGRLVDIAPA